MIDLEKLDYFEIEYLKIDAKALSLWIGLSLSFDLLSLFWVF